jgi:ribosomal peptide maturation radical SAM protein 1
LTEETSVQADPPGGPGGRGQRAGWPVVLVSMPFMDARRPSIQLGLLKAVVEPYGFPVRTFHANLDFAHRVGATSYRALCQHRGSMVGDWLFSMEAFGPAAPDPAGRLLEECTDELPDLGVPPPEVRRRLLRMRQHDVPAYLDALVESFPWGDARVVAFSSTFQQNAASFALAARLKRRHPHLLTVFGGANFDDEMGPELVRSVDAVDVAVIGEGDDAFPRLLCALAAGDDIGAVPGVARRQGGRVTAAPPAPPRSELDDLPPPDYDEYFQHAEELDLLPRAGRRNVWLPLETSRGCWWGAKHHCTFCGLNGTAMRFRAKSPGRVLDELARQARRYRTFRFEAVDNILDMGYLRDFFPALVEAGTGYQFFYEVKANLSREQLKLLARAGVTHIQPGLESLSSHVLRLMRKGVTAAQNINLLRWAQYYGIHVAWNILWGFPGETEQDPAEQAEVIPHLLHLRPPGSADRIWMERFSPLYLDRDRALRRAPEPERSYRHVYPDHVDLDRVAYFFDYEVDGALPDSAYADLQARVAEWAEAWKAGKPPVLKYWSAPGFLQIYDGRRPGQEGTYTLEGAAADLYLACSDRPTTAAAAAQRLGAALPVEAVDAMLDDLAEHGLLFRNGPYALALALPAVGGR